MKMPWKIQKKIETPAELKLEQIKTLLFPPLELNEELSNDGSIMKFHVDYSVDSNLDAALMDLQDGQNDEVTQGTINEVTKRLIQVRKLLEAYAQIDKDAKYIIVDNPKSQNIEDIT
jgi:hypothetical protein